MPTVRLDDEVFEGLKSLAEPLVDTPNSVIRRLLEANGTLKKRPAAVAKPVPLKAQRDQTPQSIYEENLLCVLHEQFRGKGNKKDVTHAVIERMMKRGLIPPADMEFVATGETRAENKISWGRNLLKNRGLLRADAPRAVWELTAEGRAQAKRRAT
jgi:hypothetical protein